MTTIGRRGMTLACVLSCALAGCAQQPEQAAATAEGGAMPAPPAKKEAIMIKEHRSGKWTPDLTADEKATLFAIAEDTLRWCVNGGREKFAFDRYTITDKLKKYTATFVTLKEHGRLRGCIGSLEPVQPLYESVHDNAINAALKDYRFSPVTPGELSSLGVDVSILSPITGIASLDEFHLGEHGIIIEKGVCRAVYLPEVAPEQNWTKEETLASLSEKAGMNRDAWRKGARFKIFSSVVLSK